MLIFYRLHVVHLLEKKCSHFKNSIQKKECKHNSRYQALVPQKFLHVQKLPWKDYKDKACLLKMISWYQICNLYHYATRYKSY